ncbi:MAG: hypothetical protein IT454_13305 [Planctomycetes bacterium]|nr:hypothetical protein [Planctomycetota bacterium]
MKIQTIALAAVLTLGVLPLPASFGAPAAAQQDRAKDFKTKLKDQVKIKAYDEIAKLLRQYQEEAVNYVDELAATMSIQNSDEIEAEFEALRRSWKDAFKTNFVDAIYTYHSKLALDQGRRKERIALLARYTDNYAKFDSNRNGAKSGPAFELCGSEFAGMSEAFATLGDYFYAARCASGAGICYDNLYRGTEADFKKACLYFGKVVEYFDKIELNYSLYTQCKQRWETLVREGHAPEAPPDPNAPPSTTPTPQPAATLTVATSFEVLKSLDEFQRPNFCADELYAVWPVINLGAKGSSGKFMALDGLMVLRPDSAKVGVDLNHDGNADKLAGITGNLTTIECEIGEGEEKRKWAFVFKTGIQEDTFQGLKTNLAPDDRQMRFYVQSAASVVSTINGVPFRVIDDNMDGVYGSAPRTYSYGGISEGIYQPEFDCVVVGESKRARPWSQFQEIGGAWYEIVAEKSGNTLKATPVQLDTGTIKLDFKGPYPTWIVLRGTGKLENMFVDIVDPGKKPVTVPAGTYELFAGELRSGKKAQTMKALMLPPQSNGKKWTVAKGAECTVQLGGPFGFDFVFETGESSLTLKGKSITVVGVAGERYERTWNCVPRPELSWRKAGTKKGSKPEKLDIVQDLLETAEDGSYKYSETDTWRPIDSVVEIKKGEAVEMQLVEKKNKLFGEIESAWK